VVFSTYHSIEVISQAQHKHGLAGFDLIVCDEAHRTTGATFDSEDESAFVKVHDTNFIHAAKRLYMTATPRIYSDLAEAQAEKENATLYGMNNEKWYGNPRYPLELFMRVVTVSLETMKLVGSLPKLDI
jgi:predicted helicase